MKDLGLLLGDLGFCLTKLQDSLQKEGGPSLVNILRSQTTGLGASGQVTIYNSLSPRVDFEILPV